jgi:trimeric autotransporter adhesin
VAAALLLVCCHDMGARAATYTVTNTGNGTGAGTLRRAVNNANANAGPDTIVFNIPAASLTGGVAVFNITSTIVFTDAGTTLDGTTQTAFAGNTNPGALGAGGTVGVDNLALPTVSRPEVMFVDAGGLALGLDIQADNTTIRGVAVYGFGTAANSDASANIRVGAVSGAVVENCVLGSTASSFADPGAGARSVGDNIRVVGGSAGVIRNNLIGFSNGKGIQLGGGGATGWSVTGNEVRGNGVGNSNLDGIDIENGAGSNTVRGNLFTENEAAGVDMYQSAGANLVENNTLTRNGIGPNANVETPGVRLYGAGNTVSRNVINANFGAGVMVTAASSGNRITRNSIFANGTITNKAGAGPSGQIGIDLLAAANSETVGSSPFVTTNDAGDADAGGNGLQNFAVVTAAIVSGSNLTLAGFGRPGSQIEFFIAAADPRGFGEGQTYLTTLTEGSGADADAGTGAYGPAVNGLTVGSDTTNRFRFTVSLPPGVSVGTVLTTTATAGANTSEFGNNVAVVSAPSVTLCKTVSGQPCPPPALAALQPGSDITYVINFANAGGSAASAFAVTDQIPANTDFKLGTASASLGTTGLSVAIVYSNDGGATYLYTPVSAGGGAPAGYDRSVTHVRWSFTGSLPNAAPDNAGSVSFTVRIR